MLNYIIRRLIISVFMLLGIGLVSFAIIQLPPGDFATTYQNYLINAAGMTQDEAEAAAAAAAGLAGRAEFAFAELPFGPFSPRGQFAAARWLRAQRIDVYHSTNFMIPLPAFPRRRSRRPIWLIQSAGS